MTTTIQPIDDLCINTIRTLSIDAVQKANSGHPGMPLGAAPMAYVLWTRHLRHSPVNPKWPDRDRFVLSAGHASMLLYSMLFLTGYDLGMDDIKQFRQWGSRTPGHPEYGVVPGAEVTTGPLGQGVGNAVGLAIAERWLAATFNRPAHEVMNHHTYVMASDGDMMEGVAAEAASIAGQFRLGRLIVLYDANQITLSASADVTFTEDVGARFQAYGWHVDHIDGMDIAAVDSALTKAKAVDDRPSLIVARTHIGYGSPHKHDTFEAHGEPLGVEEVRLTKRALGWPEDKTFYIPDEALAQFRKSVANGRDLEADWHRRVDGLRAADPDLADKLRQTLAGGLPKGWDEALPRFTPADGAMATRDAGQKTILALAEVIPNLIGGSGDLDPSTRTALKGKGDFESPEFKPPAGAPPTQGMVGGPLGYAGRNIHFGIREHAMAAIATGMALHGGILPYAATFFTFSDYMRPSIRLAALSKAHVIYVWTHDSIGLGEDGPTHQPIEQLASLRAIPDLMLLRPADANETVEAWKIAVAHTEGPVGLVFTRQKLPILDRSTLAPAAGTAKGAYVLADCAGGPPKLILIATGSEVSIALEAHNQLTREGVASRVVSMPCWDLFQAQPQSYKDMVLPPGVKARVSVEAGSPLGWERYVGLEGAIIGLNRFGASAPGEIVMRELGFTPEHIVKVAKSILAGNRPG
ncbi:MAG: transketolase [Candidatus Binatus sp.]|uniref:transketolase n=1 Tax=Candidatus Binatus sp. TaxID=2811406 RepID=UPI003C78129E